MNNQSGCRESRIPLFCAPAGVTLVDQLDPRGYAHRFTGLQVEHKEIQIQH
jgi:hypothetical protein